MLNQNETLESFLVEFNSTISLPEYKQEFVGLMRKIAAMFQSQNIPIEAKNISFFKRWNETFLKVKPQYITLSLIHNLAEIKLPDYLQNDFLLDFIWPMVFVQFENDDIMYEHFRLIKIFYNKNLIETLRLFNMIDIAKLMMKVSQQEDHSCCQEHNLQNKPIYKSSKLQAFQELISGLLQLNVLELQNQRSEDYEQQLQLSIHHLLSFCTKDHLPCHVTTLVQIIIKTIYKLDVEIVQSMFQNFESVSYLVILYNNTEHPNVKIQCLKAFHRITNCNQNFTQKLILSLIPPSKQKKIQPWQNSQAIYNTIFEWLIDQLDLRITDNLMLDEKALFRKPEILELLLSYLYLAPEQIKSSITTTLFTLTRNNQENQMFLSQHKHFLNTYPKFLLTISSQNMSGQKLFSDGDNYLFQIQDLSFKMISAIFVQQVSQGKIDIVFQWQKIIQLEMFKIQNGDNDCACQDLKVPPQLLRALYNYLFNQLLNFKSVFVQDKVSINYWRGIGFFISSFYFMMIGELYSNPDHLFTGLKFTPKIFVYKNFPFQQNEPWIDGQFLPKIIQFINVLINQTKSSYIEISKISHLFKPSEFSFWINNLYRKLHGLDRDNIYLLKLVQTLVEYYAYYLVVNQMNQEKLDELIGLLKAYRSFIQYVVIGSLQINQFRMLSQETENLIYPTHFSYIELHIGLVSQIQDRLSITYSTNHDYFGHLEEKQILQECQKGIQSILGEYFQSLAKMHFFYGQQQSNFVWSFCYEIIRMVKQENMATAADLQILINQPDRFLEVMTCEEMIAYFTDSPKSVELKIKNTLNTIEVMKWAENMIMTQQEQVIVQYQENFHRQSVILMKDVSATINKYQKIQQTNQELFNLEKSIYDKSIKTV
ncbi:hypothetical protein pb186bvf_003039 [Paramecium bursaria]